MRIISYILTLCFTFMMLLTLEAQPQRITLKGNIIEATTKKSVGYATVSLSRGERTFAAVAANADGRFTMSLPMGGEFQLTVSMVGYTSLTKNIRVPREGLTLKDLTLVEGVAVKDVVVAVQKPLVVSDAEKMTYSVEDDPQTSSSTLDEIIRKVPQLAIDSDGNVMLNGQSNFKVLVNGQNSTAFSTNFKDLIRSMPADQISRIEVITNPSIKYDAEGVGGILNLVMARQKHDFGYNGSLATGLMFNDEDVGNYSSGNISMQTQKFAFGARGWFYKGAWSSESEYLRHDLTQDGHYTANRGKGKMTPQSGGFNIDMSYQPDTLNLLTFNAMVYASKYPNTGTTYWEQQTDTLSKFTQIKDMVSKSVATTMGLNYEHNFGRKGHAITLSDEFGITPAKAYSTNLYQDGLAYTEWQNSKDRTLNNTFQVDYYNPLNQRHSIEAGMKHIFRKSTSEMMSESQRDASQSPVLGPFSDMTYRQHILAAYLGYGFTQKAWALRLGARLERTWNDATAEDQDHERYSFENRQFNWVPYLSMTFTPRPSHVLSLSYTQRLNRPDISMLSPAINISSPLDWQMGNPHLEATINHAINLQYSHFTTKWSILFGLNSFLSNNTMSSFTATNADGVAITTYSNDVKMRSYGFSSSLSWRPSLKFSLSLSVRGNYSQYDFPQENVDNDRFSINQNLHMDIALWKNARLMAGEGYDSGANTLGGHSTGYHYHYLGIKQQFFDRHLDVSFSASNPFEKYTESENYYETPTMDSFQKRISSSRKFSVRVTWRFGKRGVRVKSTSRQIVNDEMQSAPSSESQPQGQQIPQM